MQSGSPPKIAVVDFFLEGRPGSAAEALQKVLESRRRGLGSAHPQTASTELLLGRALELSGEFAEGQMVLDAGTYRICRWLGSEHLESLWLKSQLADLSDCHEIAFSASQNAARTAIPAAADEFITASEFTRMMAILDKVEENAARDQGGEELQSRGAYGSYRMQLEVIDVLYSHPKVRPHWSRTG